jgi:hypothetical protein
LNLLVKGKVITQPKNICGAQTVKELDNFPPHLPEPYNREREFIKVTQYKI